MVMGAGSDIKAAVRTDFPHQVREVEHDWIPLSDGTRLACRYWLPEDAAEKPVPAIMEYIPYCKRDGTAARDEAMHPYLAGHGYCSIRVDMRGAGESEGQLWGEYLQQEQDDAVEVIAWLAEQPWCTGRVGMFGKSWGGFNGLQVAARQPDALKAVISVYSTDDRYADDIHYMGGCLMFENPNWSFVMFPAGARPPDPKFLGNKWREVWEDRLACAAPWVAEWLRHQRRDEFWKHGSVCEDYSKIKTPTYLMGGWADGYTNPVPRMMANLTCPSRALIGPWGHQYMHQANPGPQAGFLTESLRWWDYWLKDIDTGILQEPGIRAWVSDSMPPASYVETRDGGWVAEDQWPSPNVTNRIFHVNSDTLSDSAEGESAVAVAVPQTYGSRNPMWSNDGAGDHELPLDQRIDDGLAFSVDTAPLEDALPILGAPTLSLTFSVDKPVAFASVRLCDVFPDGQSAEVTYGLMNLTHDDSHETVTHLVPGERYEAKVVLCDIGYRFKKGHRIRVAIAPSFWPIIWPSPEPVTLTVYAGTTTFALPVRPDRPEDAALRPIDPPEHSAVHPVTVLRKARPTVTRYEHDIPTGVTTLIHEQDAGEVRVDRDGWTFSDQMWRQTSINESDPLSCKYAFRNLATYGRDGELDVRIEATQEMTCDKENFFLKARLTVKEGDAIVSDKKWDETIPRDGN